MESGKASTASELRHSTLTTGKKYIKKGWHFRNSNIILFQDVGLINATSAGQKKGKSIINRLCQHNDMYVQVVPTLLVGVLIGGQYLYNAPCCSNQDLHIPHFGLNMGHRNFFHQAESDPHLEAWGCYYRSRRVRSRTYAQEESTWPMRLWEQELGWRQSGVTCNRSMVSF